MKCWHTFLLFTHDYSAFCQEFLNDVSSHHYPATENNTLKPNEVELNRYLTYIYDQLGEETIKKWFMLS